MAFVEFDKLQSSPAYKLLSGDLRRRIVSGELGQGAALPSEAEIAQRYGVHRSTVREGLRQLEQEGLLRRGGKKLLVSMPHHSDLANTAERALRMRQVSFLDVWQVASALEPLCAALAAVRIGDAELDQLAGRLAALEAAVGAGASPVDADIDFLAGVAAAAHNQALQLARGPISRLMHAGYAAIAPALPQSGARLVDSHRQLLAALRQHDAAAAEAAMRKHLADYRRGCEVAGMDMSLPIPTGD
ncbi:MAG: hypothetical protein RLZZ584_3394 [Pseudomonadota bacterium]